MRKGKNRVCSICGKLIRPGGMGGHVRLAHEITVIVKHVRDIRGEVPGDVHDVPGEVRDIRGDVPGELTVPSVIIQNVSNVVSRDLSECVRPDKKHSYTEMDIKIFFSKLIYHIYFSQTESQLLHHFAKMDLIEDFERRFDCTFKDIKRANPNIQIQMGKTDKEHTEFMNMYAHLKYSR